MAEGGETDAVRAADLLAALEFVMRHLPFDRVEAHKVGKAAIAKARGQSHAPNDRERQP